MFSINCGKCGESSRTELWIETALGQARPREHYQCPHCAAAFKRVQEPTAIVKIGDGEMIVPGKTTLVSIDPVHKYEGEFKIKARK